jgi:hypothetical protein
MTRTNGRISEQAKIDYQRRAPTQQTWRRRPAEKREDYTMEFVGDGPLGA